MNNEPVAWLEPITGNVLKDAEYQNNPFANETGDWIPLYTNPVKEQDCYGDGNVYRGVRSKDSETQTIYFNPVKELTDEAIQDLMVRSGFIMHDFYSVKIFVESVLRKASEK